MKGMTPSPIPVVAHFLVNTVNTLFSLVDTVNTQFTLVNTVNTQFSLVNTTCCSPPREAAFLPSPPASRRRFG